MTDEKWHSLECGDLSLLRVRAKSGYKSRHSKFLRESPVARGFRGGPW